MHFRLREDTQVGTRFGERGGDVAEFRFAIALDDDRMACRDGALRNRQGDMFLCDRQAEDRARVQCEFAQSLGSHGDHAGIVRTRGDLVEQHVSVGQHEQFDAEHAPAFFAGCLGLRHQTFHGGSCDVLGLFEHVRREGGRLPGFAVVAAFLTLSDWSAGHDAGAGADGQYGQLVVEWSERLHDHA